MELDNKATELKRVRVIYAQALTRAYFPRMYDPVIPYGASVHKAFKVSAQRRQKKAQWSKYNNPNDVRLTTPTFEGPYHDS